MVRCNWLLERVAKWLSQGPSVTMYVKLFGPKNMVHSSEVL